eukprot:CAMPEP_0172697562 /NCGR_PEP_ID=MMETSP1074-20121228/28855_1 /TAXON_ID=2916 /ORGANISM="Ceratium fusus, Strain PA161109" /LENGTH=34 /DNA_ID= /DNA_START= /DNA_END= /DNA_ORIENTATION=
MAQAAVVVAPKAAAAAGISGEVRASIEACLCVSL